MNIDSDKQHFLFLAGLHRSGTSLIHRVIRDHPDVSGLVNTCVPEDEGQHLQNVYPTAKDFGGPGVFAFHPEARMDESHLLVSKENSEKILTAWKPYIDLPNQYIVEKSPPNIIRSRFLSALFPESCFLFIFRHPVAVAYATRKWSKSSICDLLEHTLYAYEIAVSDSQFLDKVYFLRYEDFVANPDMESMKIFKFLNLPHYSLVQDVDGSINNKYFSSWSNDRKNDRYFDKLFFRKKYGKLEERMSFFGYSLCDLDNLGPASFL